MHRIDTATKAADLFGAGKDGFKDGNKASGIAATDLTAAFFNDIQENIAQVIEASGIALTKGDYSQLLDALVKKGLQGSYFNTAAAGGTADAITANFVPAIAVLTNGITLHVRSGSANATTTPTFTPANGTIAAKTIVKGAGLPLAVGDIAGAGHWIDLKYDLALDKWVLLNPAKGVFSAIGVDQSWQTVTRALATTYTNSTGKPIAVSASLVVAPNASVQLLVGGVGIANLVNNAANPAAIQAQMFAIVPPGSTYIFSVTCGSPTLAACAELR